MNRRDAIKTTALGLCAPAIGIAALNEKIDYEAKYWEAQRHIDDLEGLLREYEMDRETLLEMDEFASHHAALELNKKFAK